MDTVQQAGTCGNLTAGELQEASPDRLWRRGPGEEDHMTGVTGVSVVFDYDGDFERSRVTEVAKNARTLFEGMPGLRFKFFTLDEKQQRAVNFYVWESREAADAFFSDDLRKRVTGLYGVAPTIEYSEVIETVDNT